MKTNQQKHGQRLSKAKLDGMIEEAIVAAYGDSEQITGFFTMFEDQLKLPFQTEVLGTQVTVEQLDLTDDDQIVAVCSRGRSRQRIPILDLNAKGRDWAARSGSGLPVIALQDLPAGTERRSRPSHGGTTCQATRRNSGR